MNSALMERFIHIVGSKNALQRAEDIAPYLVEPRGRWKALSHLVLKPGTVQEVSAVMRLASQTKTAIVPQGGNTGLVGAQIPDESGKAVILSLSRLNQIREIDLLSNTLNVEAGIVLQDIRQAAEEADRLFPLWLASGESCQIGGNLSSNAGGIGTLSYGSARDLCLGIEVVLPTGEILDDLRKLKKDNTGYDLKNLFIGAEGTLGVITAAVLKLFPKPKGKKIAWLCLPSIEAALEVLMIGTEKAGAALSAFEVIDINALQISIRHFPRASTCLINLNYPWYGLIEISSIYSAQEAEDKMNEILSLCLERKIFKDVFLAMSSRQELDLWGLRKDLSAAQKREGYSIKHDISVPVRSIPQFVSQTKKAIKEINPEAHIVCFGHMGDGSLHYNIMEPQGRTHLDFKENELLMTSAVHHIVLELGGSISAEHGIGQMKRKELIVTAPPLAMDLMRRIKNAFDPAGIMNPGKLI